MEIINKRDLKQKIKVGMVQINNSFSNQNYLPYSLGLLQTFAQRYAKNIDMFEFLLPIYKRIPIQVAVNNLLTTDIIFFSNYVWNTKISLEIARQIKQKRPEVLIIFGGPNIPDEKINDFLQLNSFVNITCHGEGELIFTHILEHYLDEHWTRIPSISFINEEGDVVNNPKRERISDLNKIPSPYLEGTFTPLMEAYPKEEWIALLETNRGCPYSCTYCDWGSATRNKVYAYDIEKIFNEIDVFSQNKIEFVFCCDANFGILDRDLDIVKYIANNKKKHGYPQAFSVQNTKNSTERVYNIYKVMAGSGLNKGVSLSLQSLNEATLKNIKRKNISIKVFKDLQQRFTADSVETFTDLILGLPGETYETFITGVSSTIKSGQHNRIQFNNLSILPNAEMGEAEYQKNFGLNIVETKIINIHGSLAEADEIYEAQHLVVGTNTMPQADWVRARIFSWVTSLLYFDKLLQIPFIMMHKMSNASFKELIEIFIDDNITSPILSQIRSFFADKAIDIQNGGVEYFESKKWLNIWWPADELILINLCAENKLSSFYKEAEQIIVHFLDHKKFIEYLPVLRESIFLNQNLLKLPFQDKNLTIQLSYNIWDVYQAALKGESTPIKKGNFCYQIDRVSAKWLSWEDWCREVVWYGNKKGAYLNPCKAYEVQSQD